MKYREEATRSARDSMVCCPDLYWHSCGMEIGVEKREDRDMAAKVSVVFRPWDATVAALGRVIELDPERLSFEKMMRQWICSSLSRE